MTAFPPPLPSSETKDREHLRLVAVFHYVVAGFAVLGLGFLFLHYFFMNTFFGNPEIWKGAKGGPPPAELFTMFKWFYGVLGVMTVVLGGLNLLSARMIQRRRGRTFSLVVAGLNCAQFPFGTTLGIFTFIVLLRESVREIYARNEAPGAQ